MRPPKHADTSTAGCLTSAAPRRTACNRWTPSHWLPSQECIARTWEILRTRRSGRTNTAGTRMPPGPTPYPHRSARTHSRMSAPRTRCACQPNSTCTRPCPQRPRSCRPRTPGTRASQPARSTPCRTARCRTSPRRQPQPRQAGTRGTPRCRRRTSQRRKACRWIQASAPPIPGHTGSTRCCQAPPCCSQCRTARRLTAMRTRRLSNTLPSGTAGTPPGATHCRNGQRRTAGRL